MTLRLPVLFYSVFVLRLKVVCVLTRLAFLPFSRITAENVETFASGIVSVNRFLRGTVAAISAFFQITPPFAVTAGINID